MEMSDVVLRPPFTITRASHVVLGVTDLAASKAFYCDGVGLVISDETDGTVFLRGLEERCHHSLTLHKTAVPSCQRLGMRVQTEQDLHAARSYFEARGIASHFVEVPFQGLTLHVSDAIGTPLELCAEMDLCERLLGRYDVYRGGAAQRLDHYQVAAQDVARAFSFYQPLGFRSSEHTFSIDDDGREQIWGVWLQRKGNPHDIVFTNGIGPRLHHFAYTIRDAHDLIHLADVMGSLGMGTRLERGPGRHGMGGGALFVYMLDPDGHRIELFNTHYQAIDLEPSIGWNLSDPRRADLWGLPARERWFVEASPFAGVEPEAPHLKADPPTLERMLLRSNRRPDL
jgi:catechol 2,3-dioxygenase